MEYEMDIHRILRSQIEKELDNDYEELNRIVNKAESSTRTDELRVFAKKQGASIIQRVPGYDYANEPELIYNIHVALQTKAMIATVKTTSNYVIVTIILAFIAFASVIVSLLATINNR
jgi:hypothetical protein